MATYEAATAYVPFLPSFKGFKQKAQSELQAINLSADATVTPQLDRRAKATLEAALKAIPPITLDADSSKAQRELAEIRARIEALSGKTVGVDISAAQARREIASVTADLQRLSALSPSIAVNVDAGYAKAELRDLNSEASLVDGRTMTVRANADVAAAASQLAALDSEVSRIDGRGANVNVNADTSGARSSLSALDSSIASTIGKALLLGSVLSSVGVVGAGAGAALGAGMALAAPGLGAAILGLSGVSEGVSALQKSQDKAGQSAAQNAQKQQSAAFAIANAQDRVADASQKAGQARADAARNVQRAEAESASSIASAQQNLSRASVAAGKARADAARAVGEAEQQAARSVRSAQEQASRSIRSAVQQQAAAHTRLRRATEDLAVAQADLTRAWEQGRRSLQDLQDQVDGNALDQRQAALDLKDAQKDLAEARQSGDADQVARAQLALDRQLETMDQLSKQTQRLAADNANAQRDGVAGTEAYQGALTRLAGAREQHADAAQAAGQADAAVTQARLDGARSVAQAESDGQARIAAARRTGAEQIAAADQRVSDARAALDDARAKGAQRVADAQQQGARQVAAADAAVLDAQRALTQAMAQTAAAAEASSDSTLDAFNKLTPSQQKFARFLSGLEGQWNRLKETAAAGFLPGVQAGIEALLKREPEINTFVGRFAGAMGSLAQKAGEALSNPYWTEFFDWLGKQAGPTLDLFGRIAGGIFRGLAGLMRGFSPLWYDIGGGIAKATDAFARWGDEVAAGKSEGFNRFMELVHRYGPTVLTFLGDAWGAGLKLVEALAPIGDFLLRAASGALRFIESLPAGTLTKIALGLGAIVVAVKALSLLMKAKDWLNKLSGLFGGSPKKKIGEVTLAKGQTVKLAKGECIKLCKDECIKSCGDDGPDGKKNKGKGGPAPVPAGGGKGGGRFGKIGQFLGKGGGLAGLAGGLGFAGLDALLPQAGSPGKTMGWLPNNSGLFGALRGTVGDVGSLLGGGLPKGANPVDSAGKGLDAAKFISNPAAGIPSLISKALGGTDPFKFLTDKAKAFADLLPTLMSVMGTKIATWWTTFKTNLGIWASNAADTVSSWFDSRGLGGWIAGIWNSISTTVSGWWTTFTTNLGTWAWNAADTVASWFDSRGLWGWVTAAWNGLGLWIAWWWGWLKTSIGVWAWNAVDTVMSWFDSRGLWGWLTRTWNSLGLWLAWWWGWLKTSIGMWAWSAVDTVLSWFDSRGLWGWLTRTWNSLGLWLAWWWGWLKTSISMWAWAAVDTVLSWFDSRGLWGWLTATWNSLGLWLAWWWGWLKTSISFWAWTAADTVLSWFDSRGLWGWITATWNSLGLWLAWWWGWLKGAISFWAWSAADTVLSWFDSRGLWGWVTKTFTDLGIWLEKFWRGIVDTAARLWANIKRAVAAPINFVINTVWNGGILQAWNKVADLLPGIEPIAPLKPIAEFAQGGMSENHRAQITSAGGPTRIWSEPETGGEAYIPMARSKRSRSTAILGQVANRFGLSVARHDTGITPRATGFADGGITRPIFMAEGGLVAFGRRLQSMGYSVTEHPAFGGVAPGGHGATSLHYSGNAIDVNKGAGTSPQEQAALGRIVPLAKEYGLRTIFMSPGHYNHAHFDTGKGISASGVSGSATGVISTYFHDLVRDAFDSITNPAIDGIRNMMGAPPPQYRALPVDLATTARDKLRDHLFSKADEQDAASGGGAGMMGPVGDGEIFVIGQIADSARAHGVGFDGAAIGVATGIVESGLRNLNYGDRDSVGVFQQRGNGAWGSLAQRMNVRHAADMFFNKLVTFDWRRMDPGAAAQKVQVSAFPAKYGAVMGRARELTKLHGGAFDSGGIASGKGFMFKDVIADERVLPPRETQAYPTLTRLSQQLEAGRVRVSAGMQRQSAAAAGGFPAGMRIEGTLDLGDGLEGRISGVVRGELEAADTQLQNGRRV